MFKHNDSLKNSIHVAKHNLDKLVIGKIRPEEA